MRPSMALVPLVLLLLIVTAEGIRLEPLSRLSSHRKIHEEEESRLVEESGGVGEVNLCKDGQCSGTMKRGHFRAIKETHHRLPGFHADYYGPRSHKPKHH